MPLNPKISNPYGGAKKKILDAAIMRFSRQSFDETGLREIAADAAVDVAYVHRSFGSKERLFEEALRTTFRIDRFDEVPLDQLETELTKLVFEHGPPETSGEVGTLDIAIRSLSSRKATRILHDFVLKDFIEPLASRYAEKGMQRAAIAIACIAGISLLRNVLQIEALSGTPEGELEGAIRSVVGVTLTQPTEDERRCPHE